MGGIFDELGNNSIITEDAVLRLKGYIASKHPGASVPRRAMILADALNKVVDPHLPKLEEQDGRNLKRRLFKEAAGRQTFHITCSDVFQAAMEMGISEEEFYTGMEDWLSSSLDNAFPREQLVEFIRECHVLMFLNSGRRMREIAEEAEQISEERVRQGIFLFTGGQEAFPVSAGSVPTVSTPAGSTQTVPIQTVPIRVIPSPAVSTDPVFMIPDESQEPYEILGYFKEVFSRRPTSVKAKRPGDWRRYVSAAAAAVLVLTVGTGFYLLNGGLKAGTVYAAETQGTVGVAPVLTVLAQEDVAAGMAVASEDRTIRMKATAYDLSFASCGKKPGEPGYGITSSGTEARVGRTVAVDPGVIPLGSRLRITFPEEYSYLNGEYVAEDTGRLIKGSAIDIFFGEDKKGSTAINKAAMDFGIRYVDVRILDMVEASGQ